MASYCQKFWKCPKRDLARPVMFTVHFFPNFFSKKILILLAYCDTTLYYPVPNQILCLRTLTSRPRSLDFHSALPISSRELVWSGRTGRYSRGISNQTIVWYCTDGLVVRGCQDVGRLFHDTLVAFILLSDVHGPTIYNDFRGRQEGGRVDSPEK